jgi:3-phenylpropionate/trans-cinnamate dioxygenase ferredoxin subunit
MDSKEYTWHKIADSLEEIPFSDGLTGMEINGKKICISLYKDTLFACTATCPHAGGDLPGGYIDALGNIVCPVHRYKFSLKNGRNTSGEGYYLKTYPVELRPDGVFIGFGSGNISNNLK